MTWNYRILAHKSNDETYLQIHEVYYDKNGLPNGHTKPATVGGETPEEINWTLDKMKEATQKPIISANDFPNLEP